MRFAGWYELPDMTEKDEKDLVEKQWHKLRNSPHVEAMRKAIDDGVQVAPGDLEGVVLTYERGTPGDPTSNTYAVITKDGPEPSFQLCYFLGNSPSRPVVEALQSMTRAEALAERARNQAQSLSVA